MRPITTDVVCGVVCVSVSCVKAGEPIEMPFGVWTQVSPANHTAPLKLRPYGAISYNYRMGPGSLQEKGQRFFRSLYDRHVVGITNWHHVWRELFA